MAFQSECFVNCNFVQIKNKKCWKGLEGARDSSIPCTHSNEVSDGYQGNTLIVGPEERQGDQPTWPQIDERRWRHQEILFSVSESELEEVNGHEREHH